MYITAGMVPVTSRLMEMPDVLHRWDRWEYFVVMSYGVWLRPSGILGRLLRFLNPFLVETTAMLRHGILILIFVTGCWSAETSIPKLPSFLKICNRSDPNLNGCIKESVDLLIPYLKDGIPDLRLPTCEPFYIEEIDISQYSGAVYLHAKYSNVTIFGGTNFVLKTLKYDLEKNRIQLKLHLPQLRMTADYNLNGKIMMLPLTGSGVGYGNFTNIDAIISVQLERYRNESTEEIHDKVDDVYVDFKIGHASLYLNNLFNGDKVLSGAMNLFLNDNWKMLMEEVKPKLEEAIAKLVKDSMNPIFETFPEAALLPP